MQNITELVTDDNNTITKPNEIADHATKYYKALFEGTEEVSDHDKSLDK